MRKKLYLASGILAVLLLAGAGCAKIEITKTPAQEPAPGVAPAENSTTSQSTSTEQTQQPVVQQPVVTTPPPAPPKPAVTAVAANCDALPDKLNACSEYKCKFVHPLTKETLQREITGIVGGKCNYTEQMPGGGKLECHYTESERKTVAQYYKDIAAAESIGVNANVNLGSGEQKTTYTIDGKVVDNPLQEATNNGTCVISGY